MKTVSPLPVSSVEHAQEFLLLGERSSTVCNIHLFTHSHHPLHVLGVFQSRGDRMGPIFTTYSRILSLWNDSDHCFPVALAVHVGCCCL